MIILEKELNENMDSSISETETLAENQDSAAVQNSTVTQAKSKYKDFVISSNQMPS